MLNVEANGPVLNVTLNRPDVRNAFNDELIQALHDVFSRVDPAIRVIVVRGEGKVFCAGGDLNWMKKAANYTREQNIADAVKLADMFEAICRCRPLVVVVAHGAAFGGGCGLVAAADVAISTSETKFCFSEAKLGLIAATISTVVVPKIGVSHSRHLFATAEVFDANHARHIGLVHRVVDTLDDANEATNAVIRNVLACGPDAVHKSKILAQEAPLSNEVTAELLANARGSSEGKEGLTAFLEKRTATFVQEWNS